MATKKRKRAERLPMAVRFSETPSVYFVRGRRRRGELVQFVTTKNPTRDRMAGRLVIKAKYRGEPRWFAEKKAYATIGEIDEKAVFAAADEPTGFDRVPSHNGTVRMIYEANAIAEKAKQ